MCRLQTALEESPLRDANVRKPSQDSGGVELLGVVKWHMVSHFASFVVLFGALINTHVGNLEAFHKLMKKAFNAYTNKIEKDLAQQIAKFFMRHSAYLTLRSYHSWRNIVRPPEKEAPAKRSRTEETPTTSAHGGFYQSKGVTQPDFILPRARASVPHTCAIGSLPPTSWSPAFISPSTQLVIRGSPVGEVACPSLVPANCG